MENTSPFCPVSTSLDPRGESVVGQGGGVLLAEMIRAAELIQSPSEALMSWRTPFAVHDPGKILLSQAMALDLAGDAAAEGGRLR